MRCGVSASTLREYSSINVNPSWMTRNEVPRCSLEYFAACRTLPRSRLDPSEEAAMSRSRAGLTPPDFTSVPPSCYSAANLPKRRRLLIHGLGCQSATEKDLREEKEDGETDNRERRGPAEAMHVKSYFIGVGNESVSRVGRFTHVRNQPDDVDVVKGPDGSEGDCRYHHRAEKRLGDMPELTPLRGAIHFRGLVEFVGNRL